VLPAGAAAASAPYDYPVDPGTAAWFAFTTHEQMVSATQIPTTVLGGMSTHDLVTTVLDYPLFMDRLAFNSPQQGIDVMASRFNGIGALFGRPDAATTLLDLYGTLVAEAPAGSAALVDPVHAERIVEVETLLAQLPMLDQLDAAQRLDAVITVAQDRLRAVQAEPTFYGPSGEESPLLLAGRAWYTLSNASYDQSNFLSTGLAAAATVLEDVEMAVAARVVVPDVTLAARERDYNSTVRTPNGTSVLVIVMTYEFSSQDIAKANRYVEATYPHAVRETDASRRYNCHSYAWFAQSTSNVRWMNSPGDDQYWGDGSYLLWHPPLVTKYNTRWSYANGDHSALRFENTGKTVHSKWGTLPRMRHDYLYSPYTDTHEDLYYRAGT
jgi:hypothetical protein